MDANTYRTDAVRRRHLAIIDQSDMYTNVFSVFMDNKVRGEPWIWNDLCHIDV